MDLFRALAGGGGPMMPFGGVHAPLGLGGIDPSQPFRAVYRCRPVVMAGKEGLESGDKILLPSSALDQLARRSVTYPMSFRLDPKDPRPAGGASGRAGAAAPHTHCGVQEFSSEEGICYIPFWMMQNLLLKTDDKIVVTNVALKKGTYVKFRPHSIAFMQLHNPRVVLERALRNFSCLTAGDHIAIQHGDENFYLQVAELKPAAAVSIIETDVNVDFEMSKEEIERQTGGGSGARKSSGAGASSAAGSSSGVVSYTGAVPNHVSTNASAAQRDFSTGGWGSAGTAEEEAAAAKAAEAAANAAAAASSSGGSDYFAKLGGGNRLTTGKRGRVDSSASSNASAASSAAPSPTLGPTSAPAAAARPGSALGARPQSALASRPGGYSLSGKPSGSSSASSSAAASSSSSSAASAAAPARSLGSSASMSGLGLGVSAGCTKLVERQGNFEYHYEVDAAGHKRLVRRLPVRQNTATGSTPAAAAAGSSSAASSTGGLLAGKGHSLK